MNKIDLNHFLFGNILGVTMDDVVNTAIITITSILIIRIFYKEYLFYTFDPIGAQINGLPTKIINFSLMVLIALTTV